MTPSTLNKSDRRRSEDVFRVVDAEVFPRLGEIDTKISSMDHAVKKLTEEGCAQLKSHLDRVHATEAGINRIFERIDEFGEQLSDARVEMVGQIGAIRAEMTSQVGDIKVNQEKQYGGLRGWIQAGVIIILLSIGAYLAKDYLNDLEVGAGKHPASIGQKQK